MKLNALRVLYLLATAALMQAELSNQRWSARWISVPDAPAFDYGVYHFRRAFQLETRPEKFIVHVTADNRYQLYLNGERVSVGPARGDLYHWRYESVDLAPHLKAGKNVLAAVVWNFGTHAGEAQITNRTGFLLQGDTKREQIVDSGPAWKCVRNLAYSPLPVSRQEVPHYYAAGAGERIDAARYPWGWERPEFDDSKWVPAEEGQAAAPRYASDSPSRWMLVPRSIPAMEERPENPLKCRRWQGLSSPPDLSRSAIQVAPRSTLKLLFDQGYLTTAYPEFSISGGQGGKLTVGYAEALWLPGNRDKGNRNEIEGKHLAGNRDEFIADGGRSRIFRPLWWRTYRYIEVEIVTKDSPLTLEGLRGTYTGYPFERKARFESGSPELHDILDVGWRTARLCAHETYMDCPYYEQLQYAGDTRIQAMISLYMTGDGRLMRNTIEQLNSSRTAEGATYSRAPSRLQQYIPPFSLWWIGMVHDYWMYQDDPAFVREMLPGVRAVLSFFGSRQQAGGSLGPMPWWNFVDWVNGWPNGVPPSARGGNSAPLDLQLLLAYRWAAEMEDKVGSRALAAECRSSEAALRQTVRSLYWDAGRMLFADTPEKAHFSQHTNALAVLADVTGEREARDVVNRIIEDRSLAQCSIYFRYYLHSALRKAGEGDRYIEMLTPWRNMLAQGLTTWAEQEDPTRSDCHAWGASPNVEFFRIVLGIDSAAPGFRRVRIQPFPGKLENVSGSIPHPAGELRVSLSRTGQKLRAEVVLPKGITGEFIWRGEKKELAPGRTVVGY